MTSEAHPRPARRPDLDYAGSKHYIPSGEGFKLEPSSRGVLSPSPKIASAKRYNAAFSKGLKPSATLKTFEKPEIQEHTGTTINGRGKTVISAMLANMPRSVVLLTTVDPSPALEAPHNYRALPIFSFSCLTISPTPIISFNIYRLSGVLAALKASKYFLIHILASSAEAARLARGFQQRSANAHAAIFAQENTSGSLQMVECGDEGEEKTFLPRICGERVTGVLTCKVCEDSLGGGTEDFGSQTLVLANVVRFRPTAVGKVQQQERLSYTTGSWKIEKRNMDSESASRAATLEQDTKSAGSSNRMEDVEKLEVEKREASEDEVPLWKRIKVTEEAFRDLADGKWVEDLSRSMEDWDMEQIMRFQAGLQNAGNKAMLAKMAKTAQSQGLA